mmetsp:Transcript_29154/g.84304  ORF Transcript_29154/g.84304 Transcript_29154/m.84304 type:complete len:84 (-) Transcript_29154:192-443(-)
MGWERYGTVLLCHDWLNSTHSPLKDTPCNHVNPQDTGRLCPDDEAGADHRARGEQLLNGVANGPDAFHMHRQTLQASHGTDNR